MRNLICLVALAAIVGCNTTTPTSNNEPIVFLNQQEIEGINRVQSLGRIMYDKDIRAAKASDLVLEKINTADFPGFVGWVTYPSDNDYTVSFYERDGNSFKVIADVKFENANNQHITIKPKRAPSKTEISMVRARISALVQGQNSCSEKFNTIVLNGLNDKTWEVYVLATTLNPDEVQVGGHVKLIAAKEDGAIIESTPLSKSCLVLNKSPKNLPEGATLSMLTMTHIVSDYPVAIHSYLNLLHDISFAVMTNRGVWTIIEGEIELMDKK